MENLGPFREEGDNNLWRQIFSDDEFDRLIRDHTAVPDGAFDTSAFVGSPARGAPEFPAVEVDLEPAADQPYEPVHSVNNAHADPADEAQPPAAADGGGNNDDPPIVPPEAPPFADEPQEPHEPDAIGVSAAVPAETKVATEIAETEQLIRDTAGRLVDYMVLADQTPSMQRMHGVVLRDLTEAVVETDGLEAGHTFLQEAIEKIEMPVDQTVEPWTSLYAGGDKTALPLARRAIAMASEQLLLAETMDSSELQGLHSAERLVALVEAGDTESLEVARTMARNVIVTHRVELFAKLYRAGDEASLDLAVRAAEDARKFSQQSGGFNYRRSDRALADMAKHATETNRPDDARRLIYDIDSPSIQATLHAELFRRGHTSSLHPVLNFLNGNPIPRVAQRLERALAEGGYEPARNIVEHRVAAARRDIIRNLDVPDVAARLEDLTTLHRLGDPAAAERAVRIVRASNDPHHHVRHLPQVGRQDEAVAITRKLYAENPSLRQGRQLLEASYNAEVWHSVFNRALYQKGDIVEAAECVQYLGRRLRALKHPEDNKDI